MRAYRAPRPPVRLAGAQAGLPADTSDELDAAATGEGRVAAARSHRDRSKDLDLKIADDLLPMVHHELSRANDHIIFGQLR